MPYRHCIANHGSVGGPRGVIHCHAGKWKVSKKDSDQLHSFSHFENLREDDVLNLAVKDISPLPEEAWI